MTASRLIKKKDVTIAVTANAEVLFMPGGSIRGWQQRLTNAVRRATIAAAPKHNYSERPLRPHPGKHLASTIVAASPRYRSLSSGLRLYSAVGSTASYARYPDQGTGIYNGGSPYPASILPPYAPESPSLYEKSWVPPGSSSRVAPVMIKGQRGQFFFDKGLKAGMHYMRLRSFQVPSDPRITEAMRTWPKELEDFIGSTPSGDAFTQRLREWREWRDRHYQSGRRLGEKNTSGSRALREARRLRRASESAARSRRWRQGQPKKSPTKPSRTTKTSSASKNVAKPKRTEVSARDRMENVEAWLRKSFARRKVSVQNLVVHPNHTWTALVRGKSGVYVPREGRW